MNVLAIASHPDDIEFGCIGTLAKFVAAGSGVYLMVLSRGDSGGDSKVREAEQEKSAQTLGARELIWGNFTDTRLPFYDNVIQVIESAVDRIRPSYVFVHHGNDTHQDHRHISSCAVAATRNVQNVLFYEGPTSYAFEPNTFVNIEEHMERKIECLSCHTSQVLRTNVENRSIIEIAKSTATFRGTQCRVPLAEAFESLRTFLLE